MKRSFAMTIVVLAAAICATLFLCPSNAQSLLPSHQCYYCHNMHGAPGFTLLNNAQVEALCLTCHGPGGISTRKAEVHQNETRSQYPTFRITCRGCHDPHDNLPNWTGGTNIKLVEGGHQQPGQGADRNRNSGTRFVAFESRGTDAGQRDLDPPIDIVLSAHTHRGYSCVIGGRAVVQGASFGRLVSVVDVAIDRTTGDVVRSHTRARNVPVVNGAEGDARLAASVPPLPADPTVAAIVDAYRAAAAPLATRPVGRISAPFERRPGTGGDHALGRLIADAQLAATRGDGAQVALTNPGGIRTSLHASDANGTVTYADAYAAQPFGNSLVTMTLTGAQIETMLEQQFVGCGQTSNRILQVSAGFTYTTP